MADLDKLLYEVERFRAQLGALGVTVTGFEVASDSDKRIIEASAPQFMLMPIGHSTDRPRTAISDLTVTVKSRHAR